MRRLLLRTLALAVMLGGAGPPALAQCGTGDPNDDHDFVIGQDGTAQHKIVLHDDVGFCHLTGQPIVLYLGDGLNADYYVHQFPGWDTTAGDPNPLPMGHMLTLNRLASTHAGFDMFDPFLGIPIVQTDGSSFLFPFNGMLEHEDVFYRVDSALANIGDTFTVTFRLTDPSGLDTASDPFTLHFEVAPEPASAGLFAVGALAILRRRSRG